MLKDKRLLKQPSVKTRHPLPLQRPPRLEGVVMKKGIKPIRKKPKKKVRKNAEQIYEEGKV